MSHFGINLGQTAEDSDMFTNIWLSSIGLTHFIRDTPAGVVYLFIRDTPAGVVNAHGDFIWYL